MAKVDKSVYVEYRKRKSKDPMWRKKESKRVQAYYAAHPEKKKEAWATFNERHGIKRRTTQRVKYAVKTMMETGSYKPRPSRRLPEWCPVNGNPIDVQSAFLDVNITPSQIAFGKEQTRRET